MRRKDNIFLLAALDTRSRELVSHFINPSAKRDAKKFLQVVRDNLAEGLILADGRKHNSSGSGMMYAVNYLSNAGDSIVYITVNYSEYRASVAFAVRTEHVPSL